MNKLYCKELDETLYHQKHKSGLTVYVLPKRGYSKSYALFATRFGSIDTAFTDPQTGERVSVPDGVAHFLEHKMFEQPDGGNVFDRFAETGADANAFTSFNMTGYLFSCTGEFYKNLEILLDYVQEPYFTDENVDKEQGIIGQEIRMYQDDPNWRSYFNLFLGLYQKNTVNRDIAGTIESIATIDKELLYKCYRTFYHPSNMVLFCVGDVDPEQAFAVTDRMIRPDKLDIGEIRRFYPEEPEGTAKERVEQNLAVAQPLFFVGFKDNETGLSGEALLKKEITTSVLLEAAAGKSSPLYQKLYEQGLVNNRFGFENTAELQYGYVALGGESPDPDRVAEIICKEFEILAQNGLEDEAYERARRVIFGDYVRSFDSVDNIAQNFVSYLFKDVNLFDYVRVFHEITRQEADERLKDLFQKKNMSLSVVRTK